MRVDKLTNNIKERATGVRLNSIIELATLQEVTHLYKKDGWFFNWKEEYKMVNRQIYKLKLEGIDHRIQGLISIEPREIEQYIDLPLIESAPHNFGSKKEYYGVPQSLVAFACKFSFELGFDGSVVFLAKTVLIQHYEKTLGAVVLRRPNRMGIFAERARFLVDLYYKKSSYD